MVGPGGSHLQNMTKEGECGVGREREALKFGDVAEVVSCI